MTVRSMADLTGAVDDGRHHVAFFHKSSMPGPGAAGQWADASMGAGIPLYNAYVGAQAEATPLVNTKNLAINVGPSPPSGMNRYLWRAGLMMTTSTQNAPCTFVLCDYLLHYPLISGDDTDPQTLDNTATLPRYTDGAGVRMMLVMTSPITAAANVTVSYTNEDGTAGRTSSASVFYSATATNGSILSCIAPTALVGKLGPWLPLADGDYGVRSVESIQFASAAGGFMALVLVRPLMSMLASEASVQTEVELARSRSGVPRIYDEAFLQWVFQGSGTGNPGLTRGYLEFVSA